MGLDGEGTGRAPHRYTLLAWSDESGERTAHIADSRGLSTRRCLDFLLALPLDAKPFGYYLQYDWTMMLRDMPNPKLWLLFRPQCRKIPKDEGGGFVPVRWRNYKLHYLAGMFRVTKRGRSVTVWDVGRFFQAPFCDGTPRSALVTWDIGTQAERDMVAAMKAKRSTFERKQSTKIREYCLLECRLLAKLVDKLNSSHATAGLPLRTWHGPGSTASVMLKKMSIAKKRGWQPAAVKRAASCAFFGGRFEHSMMGEVKGPVFGFDIVSAYPAQLVGLPCLEHAQWEHVENESMLCSAESAVVRYELKKTRSKRAWGPLPCRMPNGTIVFPRSGSTGWVWLDEFRAARAWSNVAFVEAWVLRRSCDCVPFARIGEWFLERNRVGRKSGMGLALKLGYNSCYGKVAQCVGDPPFRSQVWAGMITSGTRAQLLKVLARADDDVLAVATDGVYSRSELPVNVGESLGDWERAVYDAATFVRPGIYWTDSTVRARGLPRRILTEARERIVKAMSLDAPHVELPRVTQFGGAVACVQCTRDGRWSRNERYGQWYERPARISFDPAPKRAPGFRLWDLDGVESRPYGGTPLSLDAQTLKHAAQVAWGNR